ncbi:uncharacterized protein LOC120128874 [Hibiscus syriacus]|nr:uncharacterized protein LOC120128874 [Hibiscus syriacus]
MNLESNNLFAGTSIPWKVLFSSIAWQIWKRRNACIFSNLFIHNDQLLCLSKNWALYIIEANTITPTDSVAARPKLVQWKPAPPDWSTLNTDGAVHKVSSYGSVGGTIRNTNGDWIIGFNKPVGISTPLQAELWGIFEGLQLAISLNITRLQCQTDCAEALNLVSSPMASCSPITLVRSIATLISKQWTIEFILIQREANAAADFLAKSTVTTNEQVQTYIEPPQEIISILHRDLYGPASLRT